MKRVFVVQHEYERNGVSEVKFIGVFSSKETAEAAVKQLVLQPGFSTKPDGFCIEACEINRVDWSEGFVTK